VWVETHSDAASLTTCQSPSRSSHLTCSALAHLQVWHNTPGVILPSLAVSTLLYAFVAHPESPKFMSVGEYLTLTDPSVTRRDGVARRAESGFATPPANPLTQEHPPRNTRSRSARVTREKRRAATPALLELHYCVFYYFPSPSSPERCVCVFTEVTPRAPTM